MGARYVVRRHATTETVLNKEIGAHGPDRHCAADGVSSVERTRILPRGLGHTGNELGHKGTTAERRLSAKR